MQVALFAHILMKSKSHAFGAKSQDRYADDDADVLSFVLCTFLQTKWDLSRHSPTATTPDLTGTHRNLECVK